MAVKSELEDAGCRLPVADGTERWISGNGIYWRLRIV